MKVKDKTEKVGLKLSIQKTKIVAPGPIILWQIDEETVEIVTDSFSLAWKSLGMETAVMKLKDACSLEEKLWPTQTALLKSRDITLPTKVRLVKAMVFPVVMYGCENWTIKKAEYRKTDAFELWCWRRHLRVLWTARIQPVHPKWDQFWVFIGRTDVEAKTPILWPCDTKNQLIEKDPDAGKDWGQEEKELI